MPQQPFPPRPPLFRRAAAGSPPATPDDASPGAAPRNPWQVTVLAALTGGGSLAGDAFRNGVEMAVQRINAGGGLFGRLVQTRTFDSQSSPQGARLTLPRVLEGDPLAVLGPVAPAETLAVAPLIRERRVLQVAAGAAGLPPAGETLLLLTAPGDATRSRMLGRWLATELKISRVALLATPDHAEDAASLAVACRAERLEVVADLGAAPAPPASRGQPAVAQADIELARALAHIVAARPQALFIGADGAQAARLLRAARQAAPGLPLFGAAGLVAPAVIAVSGEAAVGVLGFAALTPDAPVSALEDFRGSFERQFHIPPDPISMQGYMALSMLRAAMLLVGADMLAKPAAGPALAAALRAAPLTAAAAPGLLLDTSWNAAGEPSRPAFIAEVLQGGALAWSVVPPLSG